MQIIKHFGPSILKVKIPDDILINLNNYIDEIIKNKSKSKSLDHGNKLVGDVTQEFKLESDFKDFKKNCEGFSAITAELWGYSDYTYKNGVVSG